MIEMRVCLRVASVGLGSQRLLKAQPAKNVMTSVPMYMVLETGFTLVQFAVVGPLIALAYWNQGGPQQ
jgi:hypothetical protein